MKATPLLVILTLSLLGVAARVEPVAAQCTFASPNCTASMPANTNATLLGLTWTHNSGPTCPTGGDTSYAGNLETAVLGNNTTLTISTNFTVNGDMRMTNSGSSTTLIIPAGVTFHVTGNLGDCTNNNVNFQVNGTLIVDGYLSGKNSNQFSGSGSVQAGGLYFTGGTGASCPNPCNISWDVGTCSSGGTFCTLPISLVFFRAEAKSNGIHVRWITESETHVDHVTLQKSSNGLSFYDIATFPSLGNTRERRNYGFLDEHPLTGRSYYRLRETDLDGAVVFHEIVSVDYSGGRMLDLFPVPVTGGQLNLRTNYFSGTDARVVISDVTGTVLQEAILRSDEVMKLPVALQPGIYLLTYTSGDYRTTRRFVVH